MSTQRPNKAKIAAAQRFARLRAAGVPSRITAHEAWHLSGGIVGAEHDVDVVALATVADRASDAEAFLPDWAASR